MPRTEAEIMDEFDSLECQLSPENLNCVGDISHAQAQRKYNALMIRWRVLENELGRKVSEGDAYNYRRAHEEPKKNLGLPY